jgi:FecR protein
MKASEPNRIHVDVEPLGDQRWSRIERQLFEKLDDEMPQDFAPQSEAAPRVASMWPALRKTEWQSRSTRRRLEWVAVGAIAASVAGLGVWHFWAGVSNEAPTRIVTTSSASHMALGDSALDIGPNSALVVNANRESGVVVSLERGRVECEVAPRDHRHPFIVQAGDVTVRVVGTHFAVSRDGDNADGSTHASVDVERGTVDVRGAGAAALLHAGDHWSTAPSPAIPASAETSANAQPAPVPTASVAPSAAPIPAATNTVDISTNHAHASSQQEYEAAAALEKSDPDRATAGYERVAHGSGPWAANALFAEGRLETERGHKDNGRALLQRYLQRFPNGSNATDAQDLLDRP